MKDKKTNVWVPVAVIIGILLVAMIVLTVFMVVTGRSAGNTGSSSSKYHADSTQSDVKPQDSDDYIQDVSLDEFSIGGSSDDSSASDNAEAAEVAMETPTDISPGQRFQKTQEIRSRRYDRTAVELCKE